MIKRIVVAAVIAVSAFVLVSCNGTGPYTVPSTIAANCSADVTSLMNDWLQAVPAGSTINLGTNACYLVSTTSTVLTVQGLNNVTINGDGATFKQDTYNFGSCANAGIQPIAQLSANTNLTVNNLSLVGPGTCGGAGTEGDYGLRIGGDSQVGNSGLTLNNIHVSYTDGDGVTIIPVLSTCCGINTNITIENSTFDHIGYHVLTLEGVNGLNYTNNTISNSGNFADLEVDSSLSPQTGTPTGVAQDNVTIQGNTFKNGTGGGWIDSLQGGCIPQQNLKIINNTLDSTVDPAIQLNGGGAADCHDSGLTIEGNVSTYPTGSPCGGSIAGPYPSCAIWEVSDYDNVTIAVNDLMAFAGTPTYAPNTLWVPCIALAGVNTALVRNNACYNTWAGITLNGVGMQFNPPDLAVNGLSHCWNAWGLTNPVNGVQPAPQNDGAICS